MVPTSPSPLHHLPRLRCDEFANADRQHPCSGLRHPKSYKCSCCTQFSHGCSPTSLPPWQNLSAFLDFYLRYGGHPACCGSGYNEAIIAGGEEWNAALPGAIEAFFYDKTRKHDAPSNARRKRDGFVEHYRLQKADVPLLEFDRSNFERPFTTID